MKIFWIVFVIFSVCFHRGTWTVIFCEQLSLVRVFTNQIQGDGA